MSGMALTGTGISDGKAEANKVSGREGAGNNERGKTEDKIEEEDLEVILPWRGEGRGNHF